MIQKLFRDKILFNTNTIWQISLLAFIVYRVTALIVFGLTYTDSDQVVIWHSAKDFASGIFMEPCYYGQPYNSNLEGLLAVPLLWLGIKANFAVPIISSLLSALPVILTANHAAKNKKPILASLVLWLSFLLPDSFLELSIMSRGFIQGIFCAAIGWSLIHTHRSALRLFFASFLIFIGIFQNPNALFFIAPIFLYYSFDKTWWKFKNILFIVLGAIPAFVLKFWAENFYKTHPTKNTHYAPSAYGDFEIFKSHFNNINEFISQTFPQLPTALGGFCLFLILILFIHKFSNRIKFTLVATICLFLISLSLAKLDNHSNSVFFGQGRIYLGIPYGLLFLISQASEIKLKTRTSKILILFIPLVLILFCAELKFNIKNDQSLKNDFSLAIQKQDELKTLCTNLKDSLKKEKIDIVIIGNHWAYNLASMGCNCMLDSFPFAIRAQWERRSWMFDSAQNMQPKRILFMQTDTIRNHILDSAFTNKKTHIWGKSYIVELKDKNIKSFIELFTDKLLVK